MAAGTNCAAREGTQFEGAPCALSWRFTFPVDKEHLTLSTAGHFF